METQFGIESWSCGIVSKNVIAGDKIENQFILDYYAMAKEATALDLLEKEDSHIECEDIHRH